MIKAFLEAFLSSEKAIHEISRLPTLVLCMAFFGFVVWQFSPALQAVAAMPDKFDTVIHLLQEASRNLEICARLGERR